MSDIVIRDPLTGAGARVEDEHLLTASFTESEQEHVSEHDGLAFSWSIVGADFTGAETLLLVQNTSSDLILHIDDVNFSTDNASEIDIHLTDGATLTPAGGTLVVGVCLNRVSPRVAEAIARSNETANVQGRIIWSNRISANTPENVMYGGSITLGNGQSIAVDITTAPTSFANCNITGHYKDI